MAFRVPVPDVSVVDLTVRLKTGVRGREGERERMGEEREGGEKGRGLGGGDLCQALLPF